MTDDQSIITLLQQRIALHEGKITSLRQALAALSDDESKEGMTESPVKRTAGRPKQKTEEPLPESQNATSSMGGRKRRRKRRANKSKITSAIGDAMGQSPRRKGRGNGTTQTFEGWVLEQLNDDVPKSNRTLLDSYNTSNKNKLDMKGFSARMSMTKKKGTLRSEKHPDSGINYIGKSDWFERGKLKKRYVSGRTT